MVSVAREANRKHFPWVKQFLQRWSTLIVKTRVKKKEKGGMWRSRRETKEWDEDRKTETERRHGRERENKNV